MDEIEDITDVNENSRENLLVVERLISFTQTICKVFQHTLFSSKNI